MSHAVEYDPLHPSTLHDPYPVYDVMRQTDPVLWHDDLESWILTGHSDCLHVLRSHATFINDWRRLGVETPPSMLSVQTIDPPDHPPLRRLLVHALRRQDRRDLTTAVRRRVRRLITQEKPDGTLDVISQIASPTALFTITHLLGVEQPDFAWFSEVSERLVRSMDAGLDSSFEKPGIEARQQLNDLVADWYAHPPSTGIISYLAEHMEQRPPDDRPILINTTRAFLHAGYDTTARLIGNALHTLVAERAWHHVVESRISLDAALDELVRFDGPLQAESRKALTRTRLGSKTIERGDTVTVLVGAANRDPAAFDQPHELRLTRNAKNHLGFGAGIHACVGAPIALLETAVVLQELAQVAPRLRIAGEPVRRDNATLRGFSYLPVQLRR